MTTRKVGGILLASNVLKSQFIYMCLDRNVV
jgi:hypothetical protein